MNRKKLLAGVIALSIVLIALLLSNQIYSNTNPSTGAIQSRPSYKDVDQKVFADLPGFPENFKIIRRDFYDGNLRDYTKIGENYWKQPEWYPSFEQTGLNWFNSHDYQRWGVHGYGFFPGKLSFTVVNMSKGDVLTANSVLHTSWGIETWQGMHLIPVYNKQLFDVELSPDLLLLEPTFPKFYSNWTQLVKYKIVAKERILPGTYNFSLSITPPPSEKGDNWTWYTLDQVTGRQYHDQIENCKKQNVAGCDNLIELRQGKYIEGGQYQTDNLFNIDISVS